MTVPSPKVSWLGWIVAVPAYLVIYLLMGEMIAVLAFLEAEDRRKEKKRGEL